MDELGFVRPARDPKRCGRPLRRYQKDSILAAKQPRQRGLARRIDSAKGLQGLRAHLHPYNSIFPSKDSMAIYELDGIAPKLGPGAWVADSAQVMGMVELGENASVWFGCVLRGDSDWIRIGRNSNIQD